MNKQKLDFDQARARHLQLKAKLRSILYGVSMDEEPMLSHYECEVGKWMYSRGLEEYSHIPQMHELERVHASIHTVARQLVGLYQEGKVKEARRGLPDMEEIVDQLVALLNMVEEKIVIRDNTHVEAGKLLEEKGQVFEELKIINEALEKRILQQTIDLQNARERFELVGLATQDAVWDLDLKTNQLWWNGRFYTHYGYRQEVVTLSIDFWCENIHPEEREKVVKGLYHVIAHGGQQWIDEYRFRKADGSYAYVLDRGYVQHDEQGKPYRMVGSMQDVTERKLTERSLLESQQKERVAFAEAERQKARLERFFMQAPAAICILDGPDLVFELINPSYQKLFPDRPLLGKPVMEALPEIVGQPIASILQRVFQTGDTFEGRELLIPLARYPRGPLEDIYFNFIYQARFDEQGKVDGVLVFAYEVTDQIMARKSIEASAHQLRILTDALPVLIGYLDREEKYRFVNQAYEVWFQQKTEDLLGQSAREVVGEKAYQSVKGYIERALTGERLDFEARMPYRENFVKDVRSSFVPDVKEGLVVGFYTMVTDVTEQMEDRRKLEAREQEAQALAEELAAANEEIQANNEELSAANGQLKRTNVDLDNFIYTASHDLKAPISNIEGLMQMLTRSLPAESLAQERVKRITSLIEDSIGRFKKTITDLTEVTKLQKENNQEASLVDIDKIVHEVLLDLEQLIQHAGARLEVEVAACPAICFTEKNLRSVLYNLISNALKYRSPERAPWVRIHCRQANEHVVVSVEDNGLGIDMSHEQKLFAMFGRLHDHVEGSGVGLYMVKKMVENADGRIEVASQIGKGTTFTVYFKQQANRV